jgi:hypothetical protein
MRTESEIEASMTDTQAEQSALAGLTSTKSTSIFSSWKRVIAKIASALEGSWEVKKSEMEMLIQQAPVGSAAWFAAKALYFQSGDQLEYINGAPQYRVIDPSKRIITRAGVVRASGPGTLDIRVAKGEPPVQLSAGELAELQAYFIDPGSASSIGVGMAPAGVDITAVSLPPDKIYIEGAIFYNAQYEGVIQDKVFTAIRAYLKSISSGSVRSGEYIGIISTTSLLKAVRAVEGVKDFWIKYLVKRADSDLFGLTPLGTRAPIVIDGDLVGSAGSPSIAILTAGYAVEETEPGETWNDRITFTAV